MIEPMHLYPEEKKRMQEVEKQGLSVMTCNNAEYAKVIRCKECVYFTPEKSGEHWNVCRFYDAPKTADGYCNDAERKEE